MTMTAPIRVAAQDMRTLRIHLPAQPTSAAAARRHVKAVIDAWDLGVDAYVAALLASELVTNALRHGADDDETIELVITAGEDWLQVCVHDSSRSEPVLMQRAPDAEDGRGLKLLANLSDGWGFRRTSTGKAVYFTLKAETVDRPAGAACNGHHWRPPRLPR
jgi:anti-sigma regulatory factor (Ser/Thr protein kinase)